MKLSRQCVAALMICASAVAAPVALSQEDEESGAAAPAASRTLKGVWMTADFPSLSKPVSDRFQVPFNLQNSNQPPESVVFNVTGLPEGWTWLIKKSGTNISAATVAPNETLRLLLEARPSGNATPGVYSFVIAGKSDSREYTAPVTLAVEGKSEARILLEPKVPTLRGPAKGPYTFRFDLRNEGSESEVLSLKADMPPGFQATFNEVFEEQNTANLSSILVKPGSKKELTLTVTASETAPAAEYPIALTVAGSSGEVKSEFLLEITGQPAFTIKGPEEQLAGQVTAGVERTFNFVVENTGSAAASGVRMKSEAPQQWKVSFSPDVIPEIAAGGKTEVAVSFLPPERAIAGDYMIPVTASVEGIEKSVEFRVMVLTSTIWGAVGLGIIGLSLAVFAGSIRRYGRR